MANSPEVVQNCIDLLSPLGTIRNKPMFGGNGLYCDDLFFALIAIDDLYLKVDDENREAFESAGCGPFIYSGGEKPMAMSYYNPPAEAFESPEAMRPWAELGLGAARRAAAKKTPKKAKTK
ncbi:MAG: TfoX/Sxy family protein [Armatimonadetes bacterium]|nr:TfoX/Sxy family protein [Armatimonadota bacterium]